MIRVLVWAEAKPLTIHAEQMQHIYPHGIEGAIASFINQENDMTAATSVMADPAQGLSEDQLNQTDVLVFWSHKHWRELNDETVDRVHKHVLDGMGIIFLHSAHASKIFAKLMGTRTQCLAWREADERQRYWIIAPAHPITQGLSGEYFDVPLDETYAEYFEIPQPDQQIFITGTTSGEVFRSGNCWTRGSGKIFYFQAGHETYPVYYQREVQQVILNAIRWSAPSEKRKNWPNWARESNFSGIA